MAGVKATGPISEGNLPRPSPPPDSGIQHGPSDPPVAGNTEKPDAQSVQESPIPNFTVEVFSLAKSPTRLSIDIIAVHGSRGDFNSTWTWKKGKDTTPRNPTGSARPDGTPPRNPASKQGESDAAVPAKNPASKQGESNAAVPKENPASKQGESNTAVPKENPASKQGKSNAAVPKENPASKQGESNAAVPKENPASKQDKSNAAVPEENPASKQGEPDATVPGGDASKSNLPTEAVPQTSHKPRKTDEKAPDTSVQPEASVPPSGKAEETTSEAKGPQLNISGEKAKRVLASLNPFTTGSKSTKPESGGEPPKKDSRSQIKPSSKKTESTEPITEDSLKNSEQLPQRESPATVGADPTSAPAEGTTTQPVANEDVNWLKNSKMLPRAFPECHVLGFSYLTTTPFLANIQAQDILHTFAQGFLKAIKKRWEVERKAPIIFIGHELGGLIIEKALSIASMSSDEKEKSLLSLTAAVIFLDTPFPDSGPKDGVGNQLTSKVWDTFGARLDLVRINRRLIRAREVVDKVVDDSPGLRLLLKSFADLVEKNGIPVVCFNSKSPDSDQSKSKAKDTKFESIELKRPPKEICKFPSYINDDYKEVLAKLTKFVQRRHMHDAVLEDDDVVMRLLKAGADVELQDEFGRTPLQIAVMNRRLYIVRLLLGPGGANIAHQDKDGFTVLHHAVRGAKQEYDAEARNLILLLLENGADVGMVDNDNETAWQLKGTPTWLHELKDHRNLVQGVSKPVTAGLKTLEVPSKREAITACQGFLATMMEFYYDDKEEYIKQTASIAELIYTPNSGPNKILTLARPAEFKKQPICTWYHIPANNETWVQDLFTKLEIRADSVHEHMHEQRHEGKALHSRFMRPQVKKIKFWKQQRAQGPVPNPKKPDKTGSGMALYIPFLSFETSSSREQMTEIIMQARLKKNMYPPRNTEASKLDQHDDENLIKGYYEFLHPRRTLDQFYYYMLEDTRMRDENQVIQRWADGRYQPNERPGLGMQKVPHVMMADQLWLWIIDDNTVVTSFAQPWGESRESNSFDVLGRFIKYMTGKDRSPVKSCHDLAMKIVRHCLNAYNRCNPPGVDFQNVFEEAINSAADLETTLFEKFLYASKLLNSEAIAGKLSSQSRVKLRDNLFNITAETNSLKTVKHILDELNIVLTMLREQKDVLRKMPKDFSPIPGPDSIVEDNIKYAEKMEARAKNTYRALNHLLDLKQKEANSWDAQFAREQSEQSARQGNVILLFTVVTIIFLPLTFLSSFFALNIAQFPKDSTGNSTEWQLSKISKYIFGVSFGTSALFILMAVNVNRVKEVWTDLGQWAGYQATIPFFGGRGRDDGHRHISDDLLYPMDWDGSHYGYMSSIWSQDQGRDGATGFDLDGVGLHWRGKEKISESDEV